MAAKAMSVAKAADGSIEPVKDLTSFDQDIANLGKIIEGSPADIVRRLEGLAEIGQSVLIVVDMVKAVGEGLAALSAEMAEIRATIGDKTVLLALVDQVTDIRATIEAAKSELKAEVDAVAGDVLGGIIPDGSPLGKILDAADRMEEVLAKHFPEASADIAELGNHLNGIRDVIQRFPGNVFEDIADKVIDAVT